MKLRGTIPSDRIRNVFIMEMRSVFRLESKHLSALLALLWQRWMTAGRVGGGNRIEGRIPANLSQRIMKAISERPIK